MHTKVPVRILAGLFLSTLCTLIFELLISRVMSVVAWYHFAFMAVCLALFGMTVGAVLVHRFKDILLVHFSQVLYLCSLLFSYALFINLLIVCFLPAFTNESAGDWRLIYHPLNIILIFISIALPLIGSGVIVALIFSRYAQQANIIYFYDLIGASLGCLSFIPLINQLGVVHAYFVLVLMGLLAAYLFQTQATRFQFRSLLMLAVLYSVFMAVGINGHVLELHWAKGKPDTKAFFKKWNSFSYIRLVNRGYDQSPDGWGFAPAKREEIRKTKIGQVYLDIDAMAGTVLTKFKDRDVGKLGFLKYDITALPYYLVHDGQVLIIGIGGGRDILTGLVFHEKSITGVEVNQTILDVHRHLLNDYSGDLSRYPGVTFVNNEARSYINASGRAFDLIQLSLIDTFAATQAGAYALTENNLYTVEAFKTYVRHLTGQGMLSVSYWMHPGSPEAMLKLTGAASLALQDLGFHNPLDHMVIVLKDGKQDGRGVANLLLKRAPFTEADIQWVERYCRDMGFHLILSPHFVMDESFASMSDTASLKGYVQRYPLNIAPATDDRPFFFLLTRLNVLKYWQQGKWFDFTPEYILFSLLDLMLVLSIVCLAIPLRQNMGRPREGLSWAVFTVYFTAIGFGFMFIELSQLTRLSTFLGHPIYSLSIVLFSFLLSGGLGSHMLGSKDSKIFVFMYLTLFLLVCLFLAATIRPALEKYSSLGLPWRMAMAVSLVFPLGFFMGSFLPQGMRLLGQRQGAVALFWGINGASSVLGSILAMIVQISFGINAAFIGGVVLYAVATVCLMELKFGRFARV